MSLACSSRLARAASGHGSLVLLVGEPGIGKTRTAEELARRARTAGAEVLAARCYEQEGAPAFWPWLQVLRSYASARDAAMLRADLAATAADFAAVFPELRARLPDVPDRPSVEPTAAGNASSKV